MEKTSLRAVIYRQGDNWIAQGLEYDIAEFGPTMKEALDGFIDALMATAMRSAKASSEPFANIPSAPHRFFEMFDEAGLPLTSMIGRHIPRVEPKIYEYAA